MKQLLDALVVYVA